MHDRKYGTCAVRADSLLHHAIRVARAAPLVRSGGSHEN